MAPPVCVTGANGFIGGHIVEEFLKNGVDVHGTVRDPTASKNDFLRGIEEKYAKSGGGKLTLFAADLEKEGSFDEAVKGCDVVVHVAASVVTNYKKDPFVEVINPTVNGVRNVVAASRKHGVRRIVYTSSVSTILCADSKRPLATRGKPFTEDMWNTHLTPTYGTYNYSKIQGEKVFNEIWDGEWVSLLPSWVVGPQQNPTVTSSQQVIRAVANKEYKLLPPLYFDWVDVRDVARAHYWGATEKSVTKGRFNVTQNCCLSMSDFGEAINQARPDIKAPTRMMPWGVLWLASWWDSRISAYFLYEKTAKMSPIDNSRIQAAGFKFLHSNVVDTMRDALKSFEQYGILKK